MNILKYLTPKSATFYMNYCSTVRQALEKFDVHKFSVIPLIDDDGVFVTTVSEGDLLRFIKNSCNFDIRISESTMLCDVEKYRPYKALPISTPSYEIVNLSLDQNFIPMVDDRGVFIGIIKRKTIIETLIKG